MRASQNSVRVILWLLVHWYCGVTSTTGVDAAKKPLNILLLLTDDQDVTLGSFDHMPLTKKLLQDQGMTFQNAFVHTPICCPSRSSILTGRYLHNGGAYNNSIAGNCYGAQWKELTEPKHTFAVHAQAAGYTTAYAGKYLNQYGYHHGDDNETLLVPPGWDHWFGLQGNSQYYNRTVIQGGRGQNTTVMKYGTQYPRDYLPDILHRKVMEWIYELPEPWLVVAAWPTPHGPFTPAPWAEGTMKHVHPPMTENYNAASEYMQQKHWLLRQLHPLSSETAEQVVEYYQMRLEALKSIDEYQADMLATLEARGQLDQTVVLYTSDNGFQFGQHRLAMDKRHLYENDIRVPFCIRGPGIPHKYVSSHLVANIDIAPTILDIIIQNSGNENVTLLAQEKEMMDGLSFWQYAARGKRDDNFCRRRDLLISYHGEGFEPCGLAECPPPLDGIWWMPDSWNNTYNCVRTLVPLREDAIYCRFQDDEQFVEYYNLTSNPNQLTNDATQLDPIRKEKYERRLQELVRCHGESCRPRQFFSSET